MCQATFHVRNFIITIKCFSSFLIDTFYSCIIVFLVKHTKDIRFLFNIHKPTFATQLSVSSHCWQGAKKVSVQIHIWEGRRLHGHVKIHYWSELCLHKFKLLFSLESGVILLWWRSNLDLIQLLIFLKWWSGSKSGCNDALPHHTDLITCACH